MFDTQPLAKAIANWLDSQQKGRGASLNTLAGTAVVLHKLLKTAPLEEKDVITDRWWATHRGKGATSSRCASSVRYARRFFI